MKLAGILVDARTGDESQPARLLVFRRISEGQGRKHLVFLGGGLRNWLQVSTGKTRRTVRWTKFIASTSF